MLNLIFLGSIKVPFNVNVIKKIHKEIVVIGRKATTLFVDEPIDSNEKIIISLDDSITVHNGDYNDITYGGGYYLLTDGRSILRSRNMKEWYNVETTNISGYIREIKYCDIGYNDLRFIALVDNNSLYISIDGLYWSMLNPEKYRIPYYIDKFKIAKENGRFTIEFKHRSVIHNLKGKTYTVPVVNNINHTDIISFDNLRIAIYDNNILTRTSDNFNKHNTIALDGDVKVKHILYTTTVFILITSDNEILYSKNGATWKRDGIKINTNVIKSVTTFNTMLYVVDADNRLHVFRVILDT